jgi:hypothetical protein
MDLVELGLTSRILGRDMILSRQVYDVRRNLHTTVYEECLVKGSKSLKIRCLTAWIEDIKISLIHPSHTKLELDLAHQIM